MINKPTCFYWVHCLFSILKRQNRTQRFLCPLAASIWVKGGPAHAIKRQLEIQTKMYCSLCWEELAGTLWAEEIREGQWDRQTKVMAKRQKAAWKDLLYSIATAWWWNYTRPWMATEWSANWLRLTSRNSRRWKGEIPRPVKSNIFSSKPEIHPCLMLMTFSFTYILRVWDLPLLTEL